jgi:cytochrome P450
MTVETIRELEEYRLFCEAKLADPYPLFHRMRDEDPVHWSEQLDGWVLTRYDDMVEAHSHPCLISSRAGLNMAPLSEEQRARFKPLGDHVSNWLGFTDPPKHTRLRKLVGQGLTPKFIKSLKPRIQEITNELLDKAEDQGYIDLVNDFSFVLPTNVIYDLMNIPTRDHEMFRTNVADMVAFVGTVGPGILDVADQAYKSYLELTEYFRGLTDERRRHPGTDLLSILAAEQENGEILEDIELMGLCVFLFVAGHETTVSLMSNGLMALLQYPDQLEMLRQDRSLLNTAIEEFLRYEIPSS